VPAAFAQPRVRPILITPRIPCRLGFELVPLQPVAHRGGADVAALRDLTNRQALLDERSKALAIDPAVTSLGLV